MTEFRIADTFADSLAQLTGDDRKLVKTTAFDLQLNPADEGSLRLCSVDHHDKAYDWAARHLLHVACTRARDHLLVTSIEPARNFSTI